MINDFNTLFAEHGITLNDKQLHQFELYFENLVEWNEKINLTAITDKKSVYQKHFIDSLSLRNIIPNKNVTLLDVGSGAGFPSIPLKILYPEIEVTIIDALNKRITFLTELCTKLQINVELIHGRAEEFKNKNFYDFVTARAVANLRILSELCIPFVKVGGFFISMKGPKYIEEVDEASNAFKELGAKLNSVCHYDISNEEKTLLLIKKIEKTKDKYPRKYNKIKNKPL